MGTDGWEIEASRALCISVKSRPAMVGMWAQQNVDVSEVQQLLVEATPRCGRTQVTDVAERKRPPSPGEGQALRMWGREDGHVGEWKAEEKLLRNEERDLQGNG